MHVTYPAVQDPHGDRFSLRNPVMAVLVALVWLIAALQIGTSLVDRTPSALSIAIRLLTNATMALAIVHVIIGGVRDLRRAGPAAPRGFRYDRRSLTAGWLFCLVVAIVAIEISPSSTSGMHDTAVIFGTTAAIGMVLQLLQSRRRARNS